MFITNKGTRGEGRFVVAALGMMTALLTTQPLLGKDEAEVMGTEVKEHPSPAVEAVWEMEDTYWRYVQAGDVDRYLTLWHEDFIGWPCAMDAMHPLGKGSIGTWVEEIRDEKVRFTYRIQREAGQDFGAVVAVHYSTPMTYAFPDGRITGADQLYKFTHTWLWNGTGWQIISGMCAPLE
jgi:hypothetical protein